MLKLYRVRVDLIDGGDWLILADSAEEAVKLVEPKYLDDLEEDDIIVQEFELDEKGVIIEIYS